MDIVAADWRSVEVESHAKLGVDALGDVDPAVVGVLAGLDQLRPLVRKQLHGVAIPGRKSHIRHQECIRTIIGHYMDANRPSCVAFESCAPDYYCTSVVMLTLSKERPKKVNLAK